MEEVYLTREAFYKFSEELERLKTVERKRITQAIAEARAQGDLSENAEYDAAREAQAHCEARIAELETILSGARIIEDENIPDDRAYIGAIVKVLDLDRNEEDTYQLVAPPEAELGEPRLSVYSPLGQGLLGRAPGEELSIEVPSGTVRLKILEIRRP